MHCSPAGSSIHGILQARILEWAAMPSSRPRDRTCVSRLRADCLLSQPPGKPMLREALNLLMWWAVIFLMLTAGLCCKLLYVPAPPALHRSPESCLRVPCGPVFPMKPGPQLAGSALFFSGQQRSSSMVNCNTTELTCWGGILTTSWLARGDFLFGQGFWVLFHDMKATQGSENSEWSLQPRGGGGGQFYIFSSLPFLLFCSFFPSSFSSSLSP